MSGRRVIFLSTITHMVNFLISLALALALAHFVKLWIFDYDYLQVFNIIFVFAVSLRWFDFTHAIYRHFILKQKNLTPSGNPQSTFAMCLGFRKGVGLGLGMVPVFMDSGYLSWKEGAMVFDGVFLKQRFDAASIAHIEKKSSEKIRISLKTPIHSSNPDAVLLVIKDRFYPFKSRKTRDQIFQKFPEPSLLEPA